MVVVQPARMKLKLISASGRLLDTVSVADDACRVSELKKTVLLSSKRE